MQKMRVLLALAFIVFCLLIYVWNRAETSRAYALRLICWNIATDLLTNTNSDRVALVNSWSGTNFSPFLAGVAKIEEVKLGDNLEDLLSSQEHANARLCFTNEKSKHFEIRIRVHSPTNFTVLGAGWD